MQRPLGLKHHLEAATRFGRGLLVGGVATATDMLALAVLVELAGLSPQAANAPALLAGAVVQFLGCRHLVFRAERGSLLKQLGGFAATEAGTLALNALLFHALVTWTPVPYIAARAVGTFLVFIAFSYPMWRRVFRVAAVVPVALALSLLAAPASADTPQRDDVREPSSCPICDTEKDIFFMPGAQFVLFAPSGGGAFYGAGVSIAPMLWSHNTEEFGPSQGELYVQASILSSPDYPGAMGLFESGFTLSFERNTHRMWGIPYFGLGVGGLVHEALPDVGFAYPKVGVYVVWHPNVVVDLQGGYHFPFEHLDTLAGVRGQANVRVSAW